MVNDSSGGRNFRPIELLVALTGIMAIVVALTVPELRAFMGLDDDDQAGTTGPSTAEPSPEGSPSMKKRPSKSPGSASQSASSAPPTDGEPGLYLTDIKCERVGRSITVYAYFQQFGDVDGRITYQIGKQWETDQVYSQTTARSRNFEVGDAFDGPAKCRVSLQAETPSYSQGIQTMSN